MTSTSRWAAAAVAHVEAVSVGRPVDRSLHITLNFHPERLTAHGLSVIAALGREGVYRSQFETGTSNGGLTARPGGARWHWERHLFGGTFDDAPASERPKYGALNHRRQGVGGAPRFGSAHLRLAEHLLDRATFCFPDSVLWPSRFGTARRFDLTRHADDFLAVDCDDAREQAEGGVLDAYVEAHVHGPLSVREDCEAVVLDPCWRGTPVEEQAAGLGIAVEWHEGRVLTVAELEQHPDYRGLEIVALGRAVSREGRLDARIIGEALRAGAGDADGLKRLWHHVARFGRPAEGR